MKVKAETLIKRAKKLFISLPFKVFFQDGTEIACSGADVIPLLQKKDIARIEHDENDDKSGKLLLLFDGLVEEPDGRGQRKGTDYCGKAGRIQKN